MSTEKLVSEYNVEVNWIYFPLHPETPEEGMKLETMFGRDISAAREHIESRMDQIGLKYKKGRTMTFNSRRAQEISKWAKSLGKEKELHRLIYREYYEKHGNIGKLEVLLPLVTEAGLLESEALEALNNGTYKKDVDADWEFCRNKGVHGIPFFAMATNVVSGAQPYEVLKKMATAAGASKR
ncbi:MAG: hypothetical protein GY786_20355 [Proteobacteria bacterium]|nr:hypothetical protein [Pseudomonadota bacterium]